MSGTTSIVSPRRGGRGVSGVPPVRYFRADAGQPFEKALSRRSQGAGRGSHGATESRRGTGLWGAVCGVGQRPREDEADCPWGTQYCPWEPPAGSGARGGNPTRCSGPSGGVLDGCRARRSRRRLSAVSAPPASSARNNAFPGGSPAPLPGKRRSGGPAAPRLGARMIRTRFGSTILLPDRGRSRGTLPWASWARGQGRLMKGER